LSLHKSFCPIKHKSTTKKYQFHVHMSYIWSKTIGERQLS
jgi:hypothetical protein